MGDLEFIKSWLSFLLIELKYTADISACQCCEEFYTSLC